MSLLSKIVLRDIHYFHILEQKDILYCQADGSYTKFFLSNQQELVISKNLKSIEQDLVGFDFFRCHHSYLVNLHHVKQIERNKNNQIVLSNNKKLPLTMKKRSLLMKAIVVI